MQLLQKGLILVVFFGLSACAVDRCNDYVVAYDCTAKYGTECRQHYLEMCEECANGEI